MPIAAANGHVLSNRHRLASEFQSLDIKGLGHERLLAEEEQIALVHTSRSTHPARATSAHSSRGP